MSKFSKDTNNYIIHERVSVAADVRADLAAADRLEHLSRSLADTAATLHGQSIREPQAQSMLAQAHATRRDARHVWPARAQRWAADMTPSHKGLTINGDTPLTVGVALDVVNNRGYYDNSADVREIADLVDLWRHSNKVNVALATGQLDRDGLDVDDDPDYIRDWVHDALGFLGHVSSRLIKAGLVPSLITYS